MLSSISEWLRYFTTFKFTFLSIVSDVVLPSLSHEVDMHNAYLSLHYTNNRMKALIKCSYHHYSANGLSQSPSVDDLSSTVARCCGEFCLAPPFRSSKLTHPICSPENVLLRFKGSTRIFIYLCQMNVQFQIICIIFDFKICFTNKWRQDIKPHITLKNYFLNI
jgi:hypothetical protein